MEVSELSQEALAVRNQAGVLGALFDLMDGRYLFMKDTEHRFARINRALWLEHGLSSEEEMLGKTDADFFAPSLARDYVEHDARVMRTGAPILDDIWLMPSQNSLRWYRINKLPVFDDPSSKHRKVIGVAGVMSPYEGIGAVPPEYERIRPALVLADREFASGVKVAQLAEASGYSMNQFTRVFQFLFKIKPVEYLTRLKIEEASRLLRTTTVELSEVASRCGFYDQSAFTKAFRKQMGITPQKYRQRFSRPR